MKNRTVRRIVALSLGATLLLSACGNSDDAAPSPSASATDVADPVATEADITALEAVKFTGEPGAEPTLEFTAPFTTTAPVARVVTEGTGAEIVDGALVTLNVASYDGATATLAQSTWTGNPQILIAGDPQIVTTLTDALLGEKVGAQILIANPGSTSTLVMALEVMETRAIPDRAEGEAVTPPEGLPTVTLDDAGQPTITIPEGIAAPTELVAQTLIKGSGAVVESGQNIAVQYTGWKLSDGTVFDSSWTNGLPFTTAIGTGTVIPGWDQGLVGQTVGSQVLLVIPKALAYGYEGSTSTLATEDLVFVVDILAVG